MSKSLRLIGYRMPHLVLVAGVVSSMLFFLIRIAGDPVAAFLPQETPKEVRERLRNELGLNDPLLVQYVRFMKGVLVLDFGESLRYRRPALPMVLERVPASALLALSSMGLSLLIGIPVGVFAAVQRNSLLTRVATGVAFVAQSLPIMWLALILIIVFAVYLRILPSVGGGSWKHFVLPVLTLSSIYTARIVRLMRAGMLEVEAQEYIRTARAKGVSRSGVVMRHALKNAIMPVLAVAGLELSTLIGGAVVTETVFSWPGVGLQLMQAVQIRDYSVVQATAIVVAVMVMLINLLVDLTHLWLDPRVEMT